MDKKITPTFSNIILLGTNVFLAIVIIFLNKFLFKTLNFKFPVTLTFLNYIITWTCTEICRQVGVYKQHPHTRMPFNNSLVLLTFVVGITVPINNLSLNANSVGTYQLLKLLVTPSICILEWILNGTTISFQRVFALILASLGVAMFTVKDIEVTYIGLFWALVLAVVGGFYKIHWKQVQNSYGSDVTSLSIIHRIYPPSLLVMLPFAYLFDPPGVLSYQWTYYSVLVLLCSGFFIFLICISSLKVIMVFSPLTHQVLGLLKVSISVLASVMLLGDQYPSGTQSIGLVLALCSTAYYTYLTTRVSDKNGDIKVKVMQHRLNIESQI
jgi:hypothetical protein